MGSTTTLLASTLSLSPRCCSSVVDLAVVIVAVDDFAVGNLVAAFARGSVAVVAVVVAIAVTVMVVVLAS